MRAFSLRLELLIHLSLDLNFESGRLALLGFSGACFWGLLSLSFFLIH